MLEIRVAFDKNVVEVLLVSDRDAPLNHIEELRRQGESDWMVDHNADQLSLRTLP